MTNENISIKKNHTNRNMCLDITKFVLSIVIILFHFNYFVLSGEGLLFKSGYLCVDVFAMISGVFFISSVQKNNSLFGYTKNRIKGLWIDYFIALCLGIGTNLLVFKELGRAKLGVIADIFLIQEWGIPKIPQNPKEWYVSALLFASIILFVEYKIFKNKFIYFVIIQSVALYCIFIYVFGNMHFHTERPLHISSGCLRLIADIGMGIIANEIVKKYGKRIKPNVKYYMVALLVFACTVLLNCRADQVTDFVFMLVAMALVFTLTSLGDIVKENEIITFLGRLSYIIYLNHLWILNIIMRINIDNYLKIVLFIISVLLISCVLGYTRDKISEGAKKNG